MRPGSGTGIVGRRPGPGAAGVLRLLLALGTLALALRRLAARLAALAALSLPGEVEALELGQLHPREPDRALQVLAMRLRRDGVTPGFRLLREHPVGLA